MLKVKNITKVYQSKNTQFKALDNISFELPSTGFVSILGPSGCGKTTLLNIIGGMDNHFNGTVQVDQTVLDGNERINLDLYRKKTIGFIFQHATLLHSLTVYENVVFPLLIEGESKAIQYHRTMDVLKLLNIHDLKNRKINTLSGGQKQRVAIARALINDPKIILADEPTGELDSKNAKIILDILQKLSSERLVIMVTHEEKFAYQYAQQIVKMKDGKLEEIIDNEENVVQSHLLFNLTQKRGGHKRTRLPFRTSMKLALGSIKVHKFRNFLTCLGLSIGLTGIAVSLALTNGFEYFLNNVLIQVESENYAKITKDRYEQNEIIDQDDILYILDHTTGLTYYENFHYYSNYAISNMILDTTSISLSMNSILSYQYVPETSPYIYPARTTPLAMNEVLLNANYASKLCEQFAIVDCSTENVANELATKRPSFSYQDVFERPLEGKTLYAVGLFTYQETEDQTMRTLYHTSPIFVSEYLDQDEELLMDPENLKHCFYVDDLVNIDSIMYTLNDQASLDGYVFSYKGNVDYYISNKNMSLTVKLEFNNYFNEVTMKNFYEENKADSIGYASSKHFRINEDGKFALRDSLFLSDNENLVIDYSKKSDYYITPLENLPDNLFHTWYGNFFSFRPFDSLAKNKSSDFYQIIGTIPDQDALDEIVISKGLADILLSYKSETSYSSLLNTTLYMDDNLNNDGTSPRSFKIVGVAQAEKSVSLLHDSSWGRTFIETFDGNNDQSEDALYLFSAGLDSSEFLAMLRDKYPYFVIENDVADARNSIKETVDLLRNVLLFLSSISILVALLLMTMVSFISILEKRQEVGVMRSMGAKKRDISILFLNETFILGVISTLISFIGTFIICGIMNWAFSMSIRILTFNTMDAQMADFSWHVALITLLCSLILAGMAGLLPAIKIARVDPVIALKRK